MSDGIASLLNFLDAPIVVGDPDGRVIYVNPALDKGEVAAYLKWIRSDDGQKIVKDVGYFPLPATLREK